MVINLITSLSPWRLVAPPAASDDTAVTSNIILNGRRRSGRAFESSRASVRALICHERTSIFSAIQPQPPRLGWCVRTEHWPCVPKLARCGSGWVDRCGMRIRAQQLASSWHVIPDLPMEEKRDPLDGRTE